MTIDPIIVTEQVSGLTTEGRGLSKLLNDPGHRGMIRRREMNHPPSTVFEDDKPIEKRKVECDHGKEVHCPGDAQMVAKKRQPVRWLVRCLGTRHVLADAVSARGIAAEKTQCVPDSFGTPEGILSAESTNQNPHLLRHWRPAHHSFRLPAPVDTEGCGVPSLDRGGLHQMCHLMPLIPSLGKQHPKQPESLGESRSGPILLFNPTLASR